MVKPALKYDLERMAASNCRIGINGDVFDFILPSDLKRFDLDALDRELLQGGLKPIDAAIEMAYEFLKPYAPVLGPLNIFHVICLALMGYAILMLRSNVASVRGCPCPRAGVGGQRSPEGESADTSRHLRVSGGHGCP